ncbi:MAG: hypothetical protein DMG56_15680 [Acidobacteria bacterium]|nr:MAG: hypothetical protein DMG56_15680 [Acidobacteriota bacterium]
MPSHFRRSSKVWEPPCKQRWLQACLAFRRSEGRSVVDGDRTALVVEPNGKEFAEAILRLINDAVLRKQLSEAGRREVQERFSAGRMVENTIGVYQDVLEKTTPG